MARYARDDGRGRRAARRHRRAVPRRRGDGGLRRARRARGRRAARRPGRARRCSAASPSSTTSCASAWGVELACRIGINTGEVVAGDPATGETFVTGDAVNLAKRLEQAAEPGDDPDRHRDVPARQGRRHGRPARAVQREGEARAGRPVPTRRRRRRRRPAMRVGSTRRSSGGSGSCERSRRRSLASQRGPLRLLTLLGPAGSASRGSRARSLPSRRSDAASLRPVPPVRGGITYWPLVELVARPRRHRGHARALLAGAEDGHRRSSASARRSAQSDARRSERRRCSGRSGACSRSSPGARPLARLPRGPALGRADDARPRRVPRCVRERPARRSCASPGPTCSRRARASAAYQARARAALRRRDLSSSSRRSGSTTPIYGGASPRRPRATRSSPSNSPRWSPTPSRGPATTRAAGVDPRAPRCSTRQPRARRAHATLERASVIGKEFWHRAVVGLSSHADRPLVTGRLLLARPQGPRAPSRSELPGEDAFRFRHALIRDVTYAGIPKALRAELHERFADWLAGADRQGFGEHDEILGYHLEQALSLPHGARAGRRAGAGARRRGGGSACGRRPARARRARTCPPQSGCSSALSRCCRRRPQSQRAPGRVWERCDPRGRVGACPQPARGGDLVRAARRRPAIGARGDDRASVAAVVHGAEGAADEDRASPRPSSRSSKQIDDHLGLAKAWWLLSEAHAIAGRWEARAHALEQGDPSTHGSDRTEVSCGSSSCSYAQALYYGPTPVPDAMRRCSELLAETPRHRRSRPASRPRSPGFVRWRVALPRRASCTPTPSPSTRSSACGSGELSARSSALRSRPLRAISPRRRASCVRAIRCSRRWVSAARARRWRLSRRRLVLAEHDAEAEHSSGSRERPPPRRTSCRKCCGDARWHERPLGVATRRSPRSWPGEPSSWPERPTPSTCERPACRARRGLRDAGRADEANRPEARMPLPRKGNVAAFRSRP